MVETTTKNYGWVKPEIQHSPATWGNFCNNNFDAIDALVFANQQGVSPVGAISMFAGATPPANWLLCNGAVYQNSSIPLLAPILANQYNAGTAAVAGTSSAVPNLNAKLPLGANASNPVGQTGGTFSYTIALANMPSHAHPITVANPAHYHPIPAWTHTHTAYSDVHTHYVYQDVHAHTVANSPHSHNIVTGGHGHNIHTGGHSHGLDHQVATSAGGGQVAPQVGGWLITNVRTDTAGDLGGYCDWRAISAATPMRNMRTSGTPTIVSLASTPTIASPRSTSALTSPTSPTQIGLRPPSRPRKRLKAAARR